MLFGQQPNKVGTALTGGLPGHRDYDIGDFAGVYSRVRDRHSGVGIADRRGCMFKQLRPLLERTVFYCLLESSARIGSGDRYTFGHFCISR